MSGLRLKLLGGFELRSASGVPISLTARKPALLLAYLALRPGQSHDREKLAGLFWGDSGEVQARNSLRQALAVLRQHLRPHDDVLVTPEAETIAVARDALVTDVAEFERCLRQGTRRRSSRRWRSMRANYWTVSGRVSRCSRSGSRRSASVCGSRRWRP